MHFIAVIKQLRSSTTGKMQPKFASQPSMS